MPSGSVIRCSWVLLGFLATLCWPVRASGEFNTSTCDKLYHFEIRDYVVDYLRPTAPPRAAPFQIKDTNKKAAQLVNNQYPGPVVEAVEGDLVCVVVTNNLLDEEVAIHWHGQHMRGYPAFDGVYGVTQAGIKAQGGNFTYRFVADPGTHFYHAHMQALQPDRGMKGPIVVQAKNDPHASLYQKEHVVALSDEWANPDVCLKAEGAQPGNPVCAEIDKATWNGVWGDGSDEYPWPMLTVEPGLCYRFRFIGMMGQTQNFQISIAGHNMTLIALDGADVNPILLSQFNLHAGERADVVVCANQAPGNYLMSAVYDLATFLETAPAPNMPKVDSSKFWAFLNYKGHDSKPGKAKKKLLGGYNPPSGTGGGASPAQKSAGPAWDTNLRSSAGVVTNLVPKPQKAEADISFTLDVGVLGPNYTPGTPYGVADQMYMFTEHTTWKKPSTPLLHTKGQCGAEGVPVITVNKSQTVEVVINNLSPTAHVLHMHGMRFQVVNYASFSESWCSNAHFECFFLPYTIAKPLHCPAAKESDPGTKFPYDAYWGCPYDKTKDANNSMLENPLQKDMISLWRRSWAVIRFEADNPGTWIFHCHMEQHIPTGQIMAFNLLPAEQPAIPSDVPSEGPCPKWSSN